MAKEPRLEPYEIEHHENGRGYTVRFKLPDLWQRRYRLHEDASIEFVKDPEFRITIHRHEDEQPETKHRGFLIAYPEDYRSRKIAEGDPGRYLEWFIRSQHRRYKRDRARHEQVVAEIVAREKAYKEEQAALRARIEADRRSRRRKRA